ncbi:MAG: TIGR03016 family PEP-CTERM system-associated outer membrane protein [Alphaproteobacteria bacterium]|nr:MAG: TIGR03016 family PEP-CTERM system-associated outer membrane protein [Alphaproteobacteria bacterium]
MVLAVAIAGQASAGEWEVIPSLEIVETYTDNVDLVSEQEDKTEDLVSRITPGLTVRGEGARMTLDLTYSPSFLIFIESDEETDLRHFLSGEANAELAEDFLFLDARASVNQQFLDRGGVISSNQDNATDNRRTVQTYSVSPYVVHNFGTAATSRLRYRASYSDVSIPEGSNQFDDILRDTLDHDLSLRVDSGPRFGRLSWGAEAIYTKTDRASGRSDADSQTARLFAGYQLNRMVRLVGSAGYENIDDATLSRAPNNFIWDVGFTLTPGPRTTLTVRGGRRFGEETWSGNLEYRISDRTILSGGYVEEITSTQRVLIGELLTNPDGIVVDPGGFSLIDGSFRRNRAYASLRGQRGRTSFLFSGFWEEREPELARPREENFGGSARITRQFSRYISGTLSGSYQNTKFDRSLNREDDFYSGTINLNYQVSQSISGGLSYIFTYRDSTDAAREIMENAVKINVRATF